jgi:hypothetical protein
MPFQQFEREQPLLSSPKGREILKIMYEIEEASPILSKGERNLED